MEQPKEKIYNQHIPQIIINFDINQDIKSFISALQNSRYPWMRDTILDMGCFQDMKTLIAEHPEDEEKIVAEFLPKFQAKTAAKVDPFLEDCQKQFSERSKPALIELAKLMDYQWSEEHPDFIAIPTFMPFCPFDKNSFNFSVLGVAFGWDKMDPFCTAIHEISHMLLYEILAKYHPEYAKNPQRPDFYDTPKPEYDMTIHYLKEVITPILMNQPGLKSLLGRADKPDDLGNNDLWELYLIDEKSSEKVQVTRYFQKMYQEMAVKEGRPFLDVVDKMLDILLPVNEELKAKYAFWSEHHQEIMDGKPVKDLYSEPIRLTRSR